MLKIIGLRFVNYTGTYVSVEVNCSSINEAISVVKCLGIVKGMIINRKTANVLGVISLDGKVSTLSKGNIKTIYYEMLDSDKEYTYTFCGYVLEEEDNIKWMYSNFSNLDDIYNAIGNYGFSDGFVLHDGVVETVLDEEGMFSIDMLKKVMKSMEL